MKAILTGGGTGGHFFPLIAIVQSLVQKNIEVLILGRKHSWEEKYCLKFKFPFRGVSTGKRRGKFSLHNVFAMLKLGKGFFETLRILREFSPDVIIGTGGYVSVPVLMAGFFTRCPLVLNEQNILPGLTTRIFAPLAREITLSFGETSKYFSKRFKKKIFITGCPLRKAAKSVENERLNREFFGLEENEFTLLIIGGSQGAHRINQLVLEALKIWQKECLPIQLIHLTGEKDYSFIKDAYDKLEAKVLVFPFIDNIGDIYNITDLAVVRGGAVTLAELTAWGIPSVVIPYPYAAEKHQDMNAQFIAQQGAGRVLVEENLTPELLSETVSSLVKDKKTLNQMAVASRNLGQKDATDVLTERIIHLVKSSRVGKRI